ncbi:hypothetical protein [Cellulomonas xylanilytica]|uniref:Uncharacterized protein n=1 Tax=Cellulomonas xylanilytica TaxID=233583 RepID=A0A510V6F9_9CELL|nr:hypothetical protein [Cellulomonas xylanilytica]GEK21511.1 hypothetical protein CXY01_20310 [Cellulomonas xylanilytica]
MSEPHLVLLPWARRGGPLDLPEDRRDGHPASQASATAEVRVNGAGPATVPVRLLGPGDVTALAPQQVIRSDPAPGTRTFESNYLALVELDEPALPWLFTPASASEGRLRPWMCLVVVREQPGVQLAAPTRGSLPVLRIGAPAHPEDELPDLDESWAWAHAQLATDAAMSDEALADALAADPARSLSRLVSGRLLVEQTEYLACVVPTFEAGRLTGLGDDPGDAQGPAWRRGPGMGAVELPVLHHWRFATGPAGDFQSLALAIRGRPVADGFGTRAVDLSTSGLGIAGADDAQVLLAGALLALDAPVERWSDPTMRERFATALVDVLNTPDQQPETDPLLAPPRYGQSYAAARALDAASPGRWYEQLNTDPAHRVAAALGTLVVQQQQETLVAAAWDQAADLHTAGRVFGLATLGLALADSLHRRHVVPLPPESGLFVLAPLRARLLRAPSTGGASFAQQWAQAQLPDRALSPVVRRVTRSRGPAVRRLARTAPTARLDILDRMAPVSRINRELTPALGPLTFEAGGAALPTPQVLSWAQVTADAVQSGPPQPGFAIGPAPAPTPGPRPLPPLDGGVLGVERRAVGAGDDGPFSLRRPRDPDDPFDPDPEPVDPDPVDPDPVDPRPPRQDNATAAAFRAAATRHLAAFLAAAAPGETPHGSLAARAAFDEALALTTPTRTFGARVSGLLESPTPPDAAAPVPSLRFAPRFDAPMSRSLAELGQHWLLPGLDGVPADTALGLRTNGEFVEAFMVGLNHELGRELLWREYPTPMTATFFDRFWDAAVAPEAPPDLAPLDSWGDRALGAPTVVEDRFVLLLRSELIRRFPDALVSATKPGPPVERLLPVFRGSMDPDISFFGFTVPLADADDWSVVIAEQPGAPRFGFEVGEAPAGVSHAPATETTSARQAARLRQLPARITIPVAVLLREPTP